MASKIERAYIETSLVYHFRCLNCNEKYTSRNPDGLHECEPDNDPLAGYGQRIAVELKP